MAGTAIAIIYTAEGFAFAADGRMRRGDAIITDQRQKLFSIEDHNKKLAFAIVGGAAAWEGDRPIVDLSEAANASVPLLQGRKPADLIKYAELLANKVNQLLREAGVKTYPDEDGNGTIAYIVIAGYYEGVPSFAKVRFSHRRNRLSEPIPDGYAVLRPSDFRFSGSPEIAQLLFDPGQPKLNQYRSIGFEKLREKQPLSMEEAILTEKNFILAHSDPQAMLVDPKRCATVGPQVHSATITQTAGFQWKDEPQFDGSVERQ